MEQIQFCCVTNSALCDKPLPDRLDEILSGRSGLPVPKFIVLREKDLSQDQYESLTLQVLPVCRKYGTELMIHSHPEIAARLGLGLHLPYPAFLKMMESGQQTLAVGRSVGTSIHAPSEAAQASKLGAAYLFAGHIFPTDCKKDLAPRGLEFLEKCVQSADCPVYAIGGIDPDNAADCIRRGAAGCCMMSEYMTGSDQIVQFSDQNTILHD